MHWQYLSPQLPQDFPAFQSLLLAHRGVTSAADRQLFFAPPHPVSFTAAEVGISPAQLQAAVARLERARQAKEQVLIFGDYDADGVTATAVLWEALRAYGIIATPFLPHREKHGYGLSLRSLSAVLAQQRPDLLITVDNGIVAHAAFAELQRLGVDTILTDHHAPEANLPPAQVIVHTTQLCGAGVAWFLARQLSPKAATDSLDLLAIATIADQMPLRGVNRALVVHGLSALHQTRRVGLQQLFANAQLQPAQVTAETVNYVLAPRLNAMGRLKHSLDALRLICTTNPDRAQALVAEVNETNTDRQALTVEMIEHARQQADRWQDQHIIVVADASYHEGVIGLLAGKLAEEFAKPAVAIALGPQVAKASARSVPGVNIIELIRSIREHLLEAGGHPLAAGFAADPAKLNQVVAALEAAARALITPAQLQPKLLVETALPLSLMTIETAEWVQSLAPFGQANPEPILALPPLQLRDCQRIGQDGRHLKLQLSAGDQTSAPRITALAWGQAERAGELPLGVWLQLAGKLSVNHWKNRRALQLVVSDWQPAVSTIGGSPPTDPEKPRD